MNRLQSHASKLAGAALAAALAACSTFGPNYQVPAQAVVRRPAAAAPFASASAPAFQSAPLPDQWWHLYQDRTLDALVAKAFAANADLRVAAANLARSRAVLSEVEEKKRPEVEMNAAPGYGRIAGASLALPETLPNMGLYSAEVKVGYQVDLFGKLKRAIEGAEADTEAAQAAADLAHVIVAADTTRAYADACSAGNEIKVAQHLVEVQGRFAELTARRVKLGRGTALDNSRAQSQLELLRAALPPLQARRRTALYRLAVLTGEVPGNFPAEVARCETPPRVAAAIPVGDGAALLRRRPDIRQAERLLAGATARIGVATAELYPSIQLGVSAGSIGMIPGIGESNTFHFGLGPLISWNLPATSAARVHIAQAEAGTAAALARFDATVLNALRETESALTVYARELDRNAALTAALRQSTLAASQSATLLRLGRGDSFSALDAQRTLVQAQTALAASETALAADQATLFLALGGGWENGAAEGARAR